MYTRVASWKCIEGKEPQAMAMLKEACAYANREHPPAEPWQVFTTVIGSEDRIYVTASCESLSWLEGHLAWIAKDPKWPELWKERATLIASGSFSSMLLSQA